MKNNKIMSSYVKVLASIMAIIMAVMLCGCDVTKPNGEVKTLQDLKGKVVYNIGKGSVPDLTFRYILKANNIDYALGDTAIDGKVALSYVADSTQARAILESGKASYVIAAEPSVTPILAQVSGSKQLFDITAEYNLATNAEDSLPQSCLVVKSKFLAENPDAVSAVCQQMQSSVAWAQDNIDLAKSSLKAAGSKTMDSLTESSIKRSSVVFKDALSNKAIIEKYFNNIKGVTIGDEADPVGEIPPANFYASGYITSAKTSDAAIKIYAPDGSPCLALAKLIADGANSQTPNAQFNIVAGADIGLNVTKNADMAIMPINAAAKLATAKKVPIVIIAITTTGSLYMLTK